MALDYGTNAKHSKLGNKCEPDGIPYSDYHLMGMGILIFRQVEVTIVVAENDTPIRLEMKHHTLQS